MMYPISLNCPGRALHHVGRNHHADLSCSHEVDDQFTSRDDLDRQVARFGSFENLVCCDRHARPCVSDAGPIGDDTARVRVAARKHRRKAARGGEFRYPFPVGKRDWHLEYQESLRVLLCYRLEGALEVRIRASQFDDLGPETERSCRRIVRPLDGGQASCIHPGNGLITQDRDARELRENLLEQFELLVRLLRVEACDPRSISPRPLHCGGEPEGHRIGYDGKDDWNLRCCVLCRPSRDPTHCQDDINFETNQVGSKLGVSLELPFGKWGLEGDVLALDIAELRKVFSNSLEGGSRSPVDHDPNPRDPAGLLCSGQPAHQDSCKCGQSRESDTLAVHLPPLRPCTDGVTYTLLPEGEHLRSTWDG